MFATVVFGPWCASTERDARSAAANKLKMIHASQKPEDEQSAPHLSYLIPRYCGGAKVWLAVWLPKEVGAHNHDLCFIFRSATGIIRSEY